MRSVRPLPEGVRYRSQYPAALLQTTRLIPKTQFPAHTLVVTTTKKYTRPPRITITHHEQSTPRQYLAQRRQSLHHVALDPGPGTPCTCSFRGHARSSAISCILCNDNACICSFALMLAYAQSPAFLATVLWLTVVSETMGLS
jgi:hypothetical protein